MAEGYVGNIAACAEAVIPHVDDSDSINSHLVRRVQSRPPPRRRPATCVGVRVPGIARRQSARNIEISQAIITRQAAPSLHAAPTSTCSKLSMCPASIFVATECYIRTIKNYPFVAASETKTALITHHHHCHHHHHHTSFILRLLQF